MPLKSQYAGAQVIDVSEMDPEENIVIELLTEIRDLLKNQNGHVPEVKEEKPKYDCSADELRTQLEPFWIINNPESKLPFQGCGVNWTCTEREGDPEEATICSVKQHNVCWNELRRFKLAERVEKFEVTADEVRSMQHRDRLMLSGVLKISSPLQYKGEQLIEKIIESLPKKPKPKSVAKPKVETPKAEPKPLNASAQKAKEASEKRKASSSKDTKAKSKK